MISEAEINKYGGTPDWFEKIDTVVFEKLASIGYQPKQIAAYFDIPLAEFLLYFNIPASPLQYHYKRGQLIQSAKEGMTMAADAASGQNAAQAARFDKLRHENTLHSSIDEIFFTDIKDV
jgi:hypothetical protein